LSYLWTMSVVLLLLPAKPAYNVTDRISSRPTLPTSTSSTLASRKLHVAMSVYCHEVVVEPILAKDVKEHKKVRGVGAFQGSWKGRAHLASCTVLSSHLPAHCPTGDPRPPSSGHQQQGEGGTHHLPRCCRRRSRLRFQCQESPQCMPLPSPNFCLSQLTPFTHLQTVDTTFPRPPLLLSEFLAPSSAFTRQPTVSPPTQRPTLPSGICQWPRTVG